MIHPELRPMGRIIRFIFPGFRRSTFALSNRLLSLRKGRAGKGIGYQQVYIPRPGGQPGAEMLRVCVYNPPERREAPAAGLVWMHGGGYGLGIPEMDEGLIREFVLGYGCTVVAPDYCLSLTAPYPAALDDCYTALLWLKTHAAGLGVRADQLFAGGNSAGGGLAAALAIYARDRGEVALAFQMPLYPMLDDRMITKSAQDNDAPVWNSKSNEIGWKLYLGELYGTERVPAYAAPARLGDFRGLPPAFTYVGSIEPFHDETVAYMEKLRAAGVAVEYRVFDGCFHGFDAVAANSTPAKEARRLLMENFAFAIEHYFAKQPN